MEIQFLQLAAVGMVGSIKGLAEDLKEELAAPYETPDLETLIALTVRLDVSERE